MPKPKSEMLRVDSTYADMVKRKARRAGMSVPAYTRRVVRSMNRRASLRAAERKAEGAPA